MTTIDIALSRVADAVKDRLVHPARTVVLLPFAQLLPVFASVWAERFPTGFAPRFVTTRSWSRQIGAVAPQSDDFRFDAGIDVLTAAKLLKQAKVPNSDSLANMLVDACAQLVGIAAAQPPSGRGDWGANLAPHLSVGMDGAMLEAEHAVIQLALGWAASSSYETDVLWGMVSTEIDLLIVLTGLQPDPLIESLLRHWGKKALRVDDLLTDLGVGGVNRAELFACSDFEDEAQTAAACILRQLELTNGSVTQTEPVALVATDRVLTRRVRALLDVSGVAVRDETGWKLSTTRSASNVVSCLDACAWNATTDAVLDWLKNSPAVDTGQVRELEQTVRTHRTRHWKNRHPSESELDAWILARQEAFQGSRSLYAWCSELNGLLNDSGMRGSLETDSAGAAVLKALHLTTDALRNLEALPQANKKMGLSEFTAWCRNALESGNFVPESSTSAQVVILPLSQLLGRRFLAVVMPGCDEVRFNASPDLPGLWLPAHRKMLGLPQRDEAQTNLRAAWQYAAQSPQLKLLWRRHGAEGETLQLSPLVLQWLLSNGYSTEESSLQVVRVVRELVPAPVVRPVPKGERVPLTMLSASAYADLRQCPYKFFALRQLRLQEPSELDVETEKRDFGDWLHEVLKTFHEEHLAHHWDETLWPGQLDRIAKACSDARKLGDAEFLPFKAAWPKLRDGYLRWWADFQQKEGFAFVSAETKHEMGLGKTTLHGRIDRIDRARLSSDGDGQMMVLDYKTESFSRTKDRVKNALEDTQIAFYAALLPNDILRAAYVNVGESDGTELVEQTDVVLARDALVQGIQDDMRAIREGSVLAALGEGDGCEYCAARGLCRKDHWESL